MEAGDPRWTRRTYYDGLLLLKDFVPASVDGVKLKQNDYLELLFVDIEGGMDASHLRHSSSIPMRSRRPLDVATHGREVKGGL